LDRIFALFAEQLPDAPGASRLARLAKTAKRIPAPLLDDLAALVVQLDDTELVGGDIEVSFCDARYADAVEFASALRARLRRYVGSPQLAEASRGEFRERIGWWRSRWAARV
jgi:hypothetical protein